MKFIDNKPVVNDRPVDFDNLNVDTDNKDKKKVDRGFNKDNTYSINEEESKPQKKFNAPSLDKPVVDSESDSSIEKINKLINIMGKDKAWSLFGENLNNIKSPGNVLSTLQGKKADLEKMGFSQTQIDALMALADPDDPDNSLAPMHSVSPKEKSNSQKEIVEDDSNKKVGSDANPEDVRKLEKNRNTENNQDNENRSNIKKNSEVDDNNKPSSNNDLLKNKPDDLPKENNKYKDLFNKFEDIVVKMSSIQNIPKDLQQNLEQDFKKLSQLVLRKGDDLDLDTVTTIMSQIQSKLQSERIKFDQEMIKSAQVGKKTASQERINKIFEAIEKSKSAQSSGLLGKIFGGIAMAFMAIVAVATIATGVGVGVGMAMIAAMALTATMFASSQTDNFMLKIFGDSQGGQIAAMVMWTAVMIALSVGAGAGGGATSGAANATTASAKTAASTATTATSSGATVTATGTNTAATAAATASKATKIATKLIKYAKWGEGGSSVAQGSAGVATTKYNYDAEQLKAGALEDKGFMLRLQQSIDDAIEAIQKAIEELDAGFSVVTNINKANHDTKTLLARNLRY